MLCEFDRLIYPQSITAVDASSYMIALYHPCEKIKDSTGNTVTQVKAVGYCLPTSSNLRYDMLGHWSKNPKFGVQFEVESYNEVVIPTKEGIIAYLSSGQIKGIGPKIAEKIYAAFGQQSLEILDKEPERLLVIPGISEIKLKKSMIPIWSIVAPGMWWRFCHHMALRRTERYACTKSMGKRRWIL
ncbi:hypothetical protein LC724_18190 [Blautia sp. RD014234]|nr:hypothetical protein [Blautia parvula]